MPQQLTVVKSEPAPLTIVKSEPVAAAPPPGPPPGPPNTGSIWDRRNWPSPMEAVRGVGRALVNTSDIGAAQDTPKVISGETAAGMAGGTLAVGAVMAAAPEVAGAAGMVGVARAVPWAWRAASGLAGIAGAGTAGGVEAAAEGKPLTARRPGEDSAAKAAAYQAALQASGVAGGWLFNAVGRRLLGSRVAQQTVDWLSQSRAAHIEEVQQGLTAVQNAIDAHVSRQAAARVAQTATTQTLATGADQLQVAGDARTALARQAWPTTEGQITPRAIGAPPTSRIGAVPPPSPPARAAEEVAQTVVGPVTAHKKILGTAVGSAADSGPAIPTAPLRARLADLSQQLTPSVVDTAQSGVPTLVSGGVPMSVEQAKAILARNPDIAQGLAQIPPELHLPAALSYANDVVSTGESIPFADAHKLKRLMDDVVNWDRGAKKIREQATKGFRTTLRASMTEAGHAPYEEATAAYREITKLLNPNGLASQITKLAESNPDKVVNTLVKVNEPTKLAVLREVLNTRAGAGGGEAGAAQGSHAWQALQSSIIYKHLISPGIDKFDQSLGKMSPEFLQILTDSPHAKAVVDRLTTIAQAVKASEAQTAQAVGGITGATEAVGREAATAKAEAGVTRAGLSRAQREASRAVESARRSPAVPTPGEDQVSRMLTEQEDAFSKSSLGKRPSAAQEVSDVAYATFAPPGSPRQVAGLARLIWRGPNVNDLIHWASLTDDNTQLLVRAVSSPNASQTVAALARGVQEIITQHSGRGRAKSGTPPPALVKPALTPPPGPPR